MTSTSDKGLLAGSQFEAEDVDVVSQECAYGGFFEMQRWTLRHRLFSGDWTEAFQREIFRRGNAVAGIIYDPWRDEIALIEQFRIGAHDSPAGPWCLEVVAGMMDKDGEAPEQVMARELEEEAGLKARHMEFICRYLSSPGGTDEEVFLYALMCDLSGAGGGIHGLDEEHEDIRLLVFSAQEVFAAMLNGRMNNAATLIGLQWLQMHRERLRKEVAKLT
ncbi:NUDIX domain-containing protein [Pseudoteredinibacter isoporae]|uniref:ADP-ribose pyrophosphatase n=1 Tax=Pseudoteredinibacter isoporae TaxID=570281 RepID=A0A7X0JRA2_9GAMM|nr:NUDIX domain-containing protein [Pseudoteredinibacter isoporae]MBB6520702.1 ADP-ribose pyrophosphatase [Pseudoteredinibacter isoporae]NHO86269.1 NUDIX domain-containing protein [Pseudoteredinibacter isoporae]NIB25280.1 NUDIX domain-containing protein [Pseudoteredinibacter isoporae]